jgi:acyl-CoA synthetase (AMP-forming)/AMP-acid ligase II
LDAQSSLAHEEYEAVQLLLQNLLEDSAARLGDKVALVCQGKRVTYGEIEARANCLADALRRRGVERGDRVVIFADNTVETAVAVWGVLKADAVFVVVNPLTRADKLAYILGDCRAAAMITDGALTPVFADAARRSTHLRAVLVAGAFDAARLAVLPAVGFEAALASASSERARARNIPQDLAAIVYTSGSTGDPKGVMLTHANMTFSAWSISTYLGMVEDDVVLDVLPLAFDYGLYQMLLAFRVGARLVLERSFAFPAVVLRRIAEERVTGLPIVPTISALLGEMKNLDEFDFSSVRYVTNTAAALPVSHITLLQRSSRARGSSRCTASPSASAAAISRPRSCRGDPRAWAWRSRARSCGSWTTRARGWGRVRWGSWWSEGRT